MRSSPDDAAGLLSGRAEALVYELLDAHADTVDLAAELSCDLRWAAHLEYLRALQRTAHATLARTAMSVGKVDR